MFQTHEPVQKLNFLRSFYQQKSFDSTLAFPIHVDCRDMPLQSGQALGEIHFKMTGKGKKRGEIQNKVLT